MGETVFDEIDTERSHLVADRDVLSEDWIPPRPAAQVSKIHDLAHSLNSLRYGQEPEPVFIYGPSGSGKTTATRYLRREIHRDTEISSDVHIPIVNALDISTGVQLGAAVANTVLRDEYNVHNPGVSAGHLLEEFFEACATNDSDLTIPVLDRIAHIDGLNKFLYLFSHEQQSYPDVSVVPIIISRRGKARQSFTRFGRQQIDPQEVQFSQYTPDELVEILSQRIENGLHAGHIDTQAVVEEVIDQTQQTRPGNARYAVTLLREAVELAEDQGDTHVQPQHVTNATIEQSAAEFRTTFRSLRYHEQLCFIAVTLATNSVVLNTECDPSTVAVTTADVCDAYESVCDTAETGVKSSRQVRRYLDRLASVDLISKQHYESNTARYRLTHPLNEVLYLLEYRVNPQRPHIESPPTTPKDLFNSASPLGID